MHVSCNSMHRLHPPLLMAARYPAMPARIHNTAPPKFYKNIHPSAHAPCVPPAGILVAELPPPVGYAFGKHPIRPAQRCCTYFARNQTCGYGKNCVFNHPGESISLRVCSHAQCNFTLENMFPVRVQGEFTAPGREVHADIWRDAAGCGSRS